MALVEKKDCEGLTRVFLASLPLENFNSLDIVRTLYLGQKIFKQETKKVVVKPVPIEPPRWPGKSFRECFHSMIFSERAHAALQNL